MRLKKAFAVILAIAMVFGAVSLASAKIIPSGFADAAENKQANQIAYLKAIGVAKGDENGNFNPDAALTRQEFVTFVARLAGQEEAAEFMAGIPSRYLDDEEIADWARGPVNLADTNGWVQGYDDGKFHPTDSLTYAQAVTVLIRVLGHEAVVTGAWPNAHIVKGINLGLNAGVSLSANTPISRADMGRLLYNALFIAQLVPTGDSKWEAGDTLMAARTVRGAVHASSDNNQIVLSVKDPAKDPNDAANTTTTRPYADEVVVIGAANYAALKGLTVRITTSNIKDEAAKVTVVEVVGTGQSGQAFTYDSYEKVNDASTSYKNVFYLVMSDGTKIKLDTDHAADADTTEYDFNGGDTGFVNRTPDADAGFLKSQLKKGDTVIATVTGGVATELLITQFDQKNLVLSANGKVKTSASTNDEITVEAIGPAPAATNKVLRANGATVTLNGEPATTADLKIDDVVDVATFQRSGKNQASDENLLVIRATRQTIEGTVTSLKKTTTSSGTTAVTTLKLADGSTKDITWVDHNKAPGQDSKVTVALNVDGRAVKVIGAELPADLVKLVSTSEGSSGDTVTVDDGGTLKTYGLTADGKAAIAGNLGQVVRLTFAGNNVDAIAAVTVDDDGGTPAEALEYYVRSVDATNGTVIINTAEDFSGADTVLYKPAVYEADDLSVLADALAGDHIKYGDLKRGDTVYLGRTTTFRVLFK